ncbi:MAG: hypothetical protein GY781_13860 [Gammaproteobacteria bacterium]|nr:hypothetical protein [Gammaproteobacteria bacterium]
MLAQMQHSWKNGSAVRPHLHWVQQGSDEPNWLLAYKVVDNGASVGVETDFTNYTLLKKSSNAFTYVSGNLAQITIFPEIDMTGMSTSDMIQFVLFRDSANISGEFAGSDPSAITELALEFDIHYQKDDRGSQDEYTK